MGISQDSHHKVNPAASEPLAADAGPQQPMALNPWLRWVIIPGSLVLLGLLALNVDMTIARYFRYGKVPKPISELLQNSEVFGHAYGVVLLTAAVVAFDPLRWKRVPWLLAGAYAAGITSNLLKLCFYRIRPRSYDFVSSELSGTFIGWGPILDHPGGSASFPSGHTATAAGFAMILSRMWPRATSYLILLTILVGCQRIQSSAHYPSDTLVGAAVGWWMGSLVLQGMPPQFDGRLNRS